mmetsp:Transcript_74285/g.205027  ORF Transcript_74285/g.205027 Transcript_74285/m.205027 type:complete len:116 (-) Transcript_74285:5-352(-)
MRRGKRLGSWRHRRPRGQPASVEEEPEGGAPVALGLLVPAPAGRRQHLHYHHHTAEADVPPRARRLLDELRGTLANGNARPAGGLSTGCVQANMDDSCIGSGSPDGLDMRLPRLA